MSSSSSLFQFAIGQANDGLDLSEDQTGELIDAMLDGHAEEQQVAQLLLALRAKGESVSELVGAARAMRRHMTPISHQHSVLLDTCGTGGSCSGTFNISTAVAIVAAAAGVAVAKHGNRKATSRTGSADVLEVLGVKIESDADQVSKRLNDLGICFCFAAKLHPAMRHVVGIRRQLGVKTLFNFLGPLCNPAGATHQLLGTPTAQTQQMISAAISQLGTTRAMIVHSSDDQDEVSLCGMTDVVDVQGQKVDGQTAQPPTIAQYSWTAADFGLLPLGIDALAASDPQESAAIIERIFAGEPGPCRDTVVAGTAAALLLVNRVDDLASGARLAEDVIDSDAAKEKLKQLASA